MRLKTKFQDVEFKLGEVVDAGTYYGGPCEIKILACTSQGKPRVFDYDSLASMHEKWEDVPEEPKEYWYIESDGSIVQNHKPTYVNHLLDGLKSIGNYFESEEEAKRALEKLKALKHTCESEECEVIGNVHEPPKDFRPEHLKRMGVSISKGGEE